MMRLRGLLPALSLLSLACMSTPVDDNLAQGGGSDSETLTGIAFFPGTDILAHCDAIKAATVDSVPLGLLRFVVQSRAGWQHDTTLSAARDTTKVSASKNTLILLP